MSSKGRQTRSKRGLSIQSVRRSRTLGTCMGKRLEKLWSQYAFRQ